MIPVVVGVLSTIVATVISFLKEQTDMRLENARNQVMAATAVCDDLMDSLDTILSKLQHGAMHAVFRRHRRHQEQQGQTPGTANSTASEDALAAHDEAIWNEYHQGMSDFRSNHITYETKLMAFFGTDGYEPKLYRAIAEQVDRIDETLFQYYYHVTSETTSTTTPEQAHMQVRALCHDTRAKIRIISLVMISCIQKRNIGNLRHREEIIPEAYQRQANVYVRDGDHQGAAAETKADV